MHQDDLRRGGQDDPSHTTISKLRRLLDFQITPAVTLLWAALLGLTYLSLFVTAVLASVPLFAAALLGSYLAEAGTARHASPVLVALGRVQLPTSLRLVARDAALLLLMISAGQHAQSTVLIMTVGLATLHLTRSSIFLIREHVRRRRALPIVARNVDLSDLQIPDTPPRFLMYGNNRRWLHLSLPIAAGLLLDLALDTNVLGLTGLGIGLSTAVVCAGVLAVHYLRARHLGDRQDIIRLVHEKVMNYRPEVALYHSGGKGSIFQVNMWLSTLASLDQRPMIIIREKEHLAKIASTHVPVICIPNASDLMHFELPDLKVVLYVSNVGKNIHMQQFDTAKHVFIGHGDSDKKSSARPVSRVYDEVWVAGRAGRDRYHRARVGVRDEAIVEVGRPQLTTVERVNPQPPKIFTVLYAPTWEGWSADMRLTSVDLTGQRIIETLLACTPPVRVIYKPHPLTGVRSAQVQRANEAIIASLRAANTAREAEPQWAEAVTQATASRAAAGERLAELDRRQSDLLRGPKWQDQAQYARDNGFADPSVHATVERIGAEWQEYYWDAAGWWSHRTVTESRPDLYSCFNQADLLISDISSVVSDFVVSEKPYVVTNLYDVEEETFRTEQTAARGAYLLGSDGTGLAEILDLVRGSDMDDMAEPRRATKYYLLGAEKPDAMTRFKDAVAELAKKRDDERHLTTTQTHIAAPDDDGVAITQTAESVGANGNILH